MKEINNTTSSWLKTTFVHIIILFFCTCSYSQNSKLAISSNLGYDQYKTWNLDANSNIDEDLSFSMNLGVYGNSDIRNNLFLRYGISFNKSFRSFRYRFKYPQPENPQHFSFYTNYEIDRNRSLTFITTPIAVGLKIKKFNLLLGAQTIFTTNIDIAESEIRLYNFSTNSPEIIVEENRNHILRLEEFIGLEYLKWKNTSLNLLVYYSHNSSHFDALTPKFRIMVGVNQYLF